MTKKSIAGHMDSVNTKGISNFEDRMAFRSNRKLMRNLLRKAVGNKGLRKAWYSFKEKRYW
jgi:hypothetical protein